MDVETPAETFTSVQAPSYGQPGATQDKAAEIAFFGQFAGSKEYDVLTESTYRRILDHFEKQVQPRAGEVFGDFGCGSAAIASRVKSRWPFLTVKGVDLTEPLITHNKEKFKGIDFTVDDIESTRFEPSSFDIIMYSGVLHHFRDVTRVFAEAFRLLKPGGRVFAYDPNHYHPVMWLYRSPDSPVCSRSGITTNERLLKSEELAHQLGTAGFRKIRIQPKSGIGYCYVDSRLMRWILPIYNFVDLLFEWSGFGRKWGAFLLTSARKPASKKTP